MAVSFQCMTKFTTNNKKIKEKTEAPKIKLSTSVESYKKQGDSRKHLLLPHWLL